MMHWLAVLCLAWMTGNEVCVAAFVQPVLRGLPEPAQAGAAPRFAGSLGRIMPFWYAVSLLLTAADAWASRTAQGGRPTGAMVSLGLQILVLGGTLGLLVPINNRLTQMTGSYPGWLVDARRWDTLHRMRVLLLLAACVLLVVLRPPTT